VRTALRSLLSQKRRDTAGCCFAIPGSAAIAEDLFKFGKAIEPGLERKRTADPWACKCLKGTECDAIHAVLCGARDNPCCS